MLRSLGRPEPGLHEAALEGVDANGKHAAVREEPALQDAPGTSIAQVATFVLVRQIAAASCHGARYARRRAPAHQDRPELTVFAGSR